MGSLPPRSALIRLLERGPRVEVIEPLVELIAGAAGITIEVGVDDLKRIVHALVLLLVDDLLRGDVEEDLLRDVGAHVNALGVLLKVNALRIRAQITAHRRELKLSV